MIVNCKLQYDVEDESSKGLIGWWSRNIYWIKSSLLTHWLSSLRYRYLDATLNQVPLPLPSHETMRLLLFKHLITRGSNIQWLRRTTIIASVFRLGQQVMEHMSIMIIPTVSLSSITTMLNRKRMGNWVMSLFYLIYFLIHLAELRRWGLWIGNTILYRLRAWAETFMTM